VAILVVALRSCGCSFQRALAPDPYNLLTQGAGLMTEVGLLALPMTHISPAASICRGIDRRVVRDHAPASPGKNLGFPAAAAIAFAIRVEASPGFVNVVA